eukprot:TRINITY_DN7432_c1_g1_i1.p1 TRINITY_DN7432_c1_g1~~TRINITY_DN7432_c1_g1_i1.p1  ORF type:complete len:106 (-),score=24.51 TRINITY_DN7432_c1_g1_i1:65-382(-)
MAALRARSCLLTAALLLVTACWSLQAFVPAQRAEPALRGAQATAAASVAAVASLPLAASAADEYLNYNFAGEFTPYMIIGYFGTTTAMTAIAFLSYLILTKLKII